VSPSAIVAITIRTSIVLTVLSVGLSARPADALSVVRSPTQLVRSMWAMMFVVPVCAAVFASSFELEPAVKIALAALAVSPVPPFWPAKSKRAGGDESYTVGLLVASSLLSIVTIPIALEMFGMFFSIKIVIPLTKIAGLIFGTIILPLLIGMSIRALASTLAYRSARVVGLVGMALLGFSVVPILFRAWDSVSALVSDGTMLTIAAFTLVGLIAGLVFGGPTDDERTVLALACTTRHPAIALAIAHANFPSSKLVPAAIILYILVSGVVSAPYLRWSRRHLRPRPNRIAILR
jgi:BASS family bile acid:Na+ symporter